MTPGPGIEPWTHWWEASALTTTPSLLPCSNFSRCKKGSKELLYSKCRWQTLEADKNESIQQSIKKQGFSMWLKKSEVKMKKGWVNEVGEKKWWPFSWKYGCVGGAGTAVGFLCLFPL